MHMALAKKYLPGMNGRDINEYRTQPAEVYTIVRKFVDIPDLLRFAGVEEVPISFDLEIDGHVTLTNGMEVLDYYVLGSQKLSPAQVDTIILYMNALEAKVYDRLSQFRDDLSYYDMEQHLKSLEPDQGHNIDSNPIFDTLCYVMRFIREIKQRRLGLES